MKYFAYCSTLIFEADGEIPGAGNFAGEVFQ
jgi:hypothetical protein